MCEIKRNKTDFHTALKSKSLNLHRYKPKYKTTGVLFKRLLSVYFTVDFEMNLQKLIIFLENRRNKPYIQT